MTVEDAATLALSTHGAVWIAAAAAYYRYGDRTEFFDKSLQGCRRIRQSIRDAIASSLSAHLGPVVRESSRIRSALLDADGAYIDQPANLAESEPYYQAIRDFVSGTAGALVDYRLALDTVNSWRVWAHRLSKCILSLVIFETVMLAWPIMALVRLDPTDQTPRWWFALGSLPTAGIVFALFTCLVIVHVKHGAIIDLKERYDPDS